MDIGATNARLIAIDGRSGVVAVRRRDGTDRPQSPYPQLDVGRIWPWLLEALADLAARFDPECLIPCTHGSAVVPLAGARPALPPLYYEAEPPAWVIEAYGRIEPPFGEVFAPTNPAAITVGRQLLWLEQAFPEGWARVDAILPYAQYWAMRLTGRKSSELTSLGAQTHLWDVQGGCFSSLARSRGWDRLFPPLRPAASVLAPILPQVAAATGLRPGLPVLVGIHDSSANLLRYRALDDGPFTLMSTGTWLINFNTGQPIDALVPERDTCTNTDPAGRPLACSRFMIGREYACVSKGAHEAPDAELIAALVARGTMALPSFTDTGGPVPGTGGRGRVVGPEPESPAAWAALASLYCALMSVEAIAAIGAGGRLYIDGPFAQHPVYGGLVAALCPGAEVFLSTQEYGTALGAATLWAAPPAAASALDRARPLSVPGLDAYRKRWREEAMA